MSQIKLHAPPQSYLDLVCQFPLRPIRTEKQYTIAESLAGKLAVREGRLDPWEADYLEVLSDLIEAYDDEHFRMELTDASPVEILKYLMKENEMQPAELGRLLGSKGLASDILHGKRQMSKATILKLAARFNVEPSLFLPAAMPKRARKSA
jgi:HTH-type transcriptional regulator/antitoxin HigA